MSAPSSLRDHVTPLVDWARDGPERIRAVMHPLGEMLQWAGEVIE